MVLIAPDPAPASRSLIRLYKKDEIAENVFIHSLVTFRKIVKEEKIDNECIPSRRELNVIQNKYKEL